jgi:hypothetical protein
MVNHPSPSDPQIPSDSLRLQLTLSVQEPQHELYALCLGPPAFKEPVKPLDLGELLSHATGAVLRNVIVTTESFFVVEPQKKTIIPKLSIVKDIIFFVHGSYGSLMFFSQ